MDHRKLGLRIYATASGYPAAFSLADRLVEQLSTRVTVRECRVYSYWKFDDQFGLWLELSAPDQAAAFDRLSGTLAPGWLATDRPGDRSAIWNQETHGGGVALPEATWMHLELWGDIDGA